MLIATTQSRMPQNPKDLFKFVIELLLPRCADWKTAGRKSDPRRQYMENS